MKKHFRAITYRFYDKDVYFDFMDKARRDDFSLQSFVDQAINDYLSGDYKPKEGKE